MDSLRISLILLGAVLILAFYAWERFKRRREDDRYQRWGGVREEGTETHVISSEHKNDLHDDIGTIDTFSDHVPSEPLADNNFYIEEPDLESDPEQNQDPIPDIRSELEALEEIITAEESEQDQMQIGELDVEVEPHTEQEQASFEQPERIIALHVMSQEGERFSGPELLQAFMRVDLQYGDMNIFHRLQEGSDIPVFSLANAVEPGTFDLSAMEETSTPALIIIMTLPHRMDALEVFDDMLDTARKLSEELNGRLCDDHRSVLTRQAIDELRSSLNSYTLSRTITD